MSEQALSIIEGGAVARRSVGAVSSFQPTSVDELMRFVANIADSDLVPKEMRNKPANIILAIQMGAELGMKPMQALQSIAVINGRPSVWGDGLLGIVQASGLLEDFEEQLECDPQGDPIAAACMVKRLGRTREKISVFTVADAKKAGLWGKPGPWSQYPKRMLQLRARSFALRDEFSDVLKGMRTAEEALDMIIEADQSQAPSSVASGKAASVRDRMRDQIQRQASARPAQARNAAPSQAAGGPTLANSTNTQFDQCPSCHAPKGKKHATTCKQPAAAPAEPELTPRQQFMRMWEACKLPQGASHEAAALSEMLGREVGRHAPPLDSEFEEAIPLFGPWFEKRQPAGNQPAAEERAEDHTGGARAQDIFADE